MLTDFLKNNTQKLHDEIEYKLESNKLFNGSFSEKNYYKMLQVNHVLLKCYENSITKFLTQKDKENLSHINFDKLNLIEQDLKELGVQELDFSKLFELQNRAEAFGSLYVIEGSMLGGNVIAKTLRKYPNLEGKKFNYFGHYGKELGNGWKTFTSYLNEEFITQKDKEDVYMGAKKTFKTLINIA